MIRYFIDGEEVEFNIFDGALAQDISDQVRENIEDEGTNDYIDQMEEAFDRAYEEAWDELEDNEFIQIYEHQFELRKD